MTELYIFDQDDHLLTIISEETGLLSTQFREELNHIPDTPFVFSVEADIPKAKYIVEENQVVFRDTEGDLRLFRIKEIDDQDNIDGPVTTATCEPACMELNDHIIVDRRFVDKQAQEAIDAALEGTRWTGTVEVELSTATTNFYYTSSIEAIWNILQVWGGDFKDVVTFDSQNNITSRQIRIKQRLGADHGKRFEIDHNTTEIGRTVLSYPVTALYGRGASLPIEDDDGEHTGGYTRYIDFADVVWSKANGDPVDKPKGQRWVGDPNALKKYGYLQNGKRLHRYGIWQNQDIEDPAELLRATWEQLETAQKPEVNYRLSVDLFDKKVSLGDTARAIDRQFARPIEIQARIVAVEYDLLDIEGTMVVEMGQLLNLDDDRLDRVIETINRNQGKWDSGGTITRGRFPDIKPSKPANLRAEGGFEAIQLYWDYADELYIDNYEVYGSQVKDFVPDSQHLLWRGKVSAFAHRVERDQVWYYRVRAVNYHGRPSDYSDQVSASTHRVISDDILFGPDLAERLRELNRISDIIGEGGVDFENISEHARNLLEQEARRYTDAEIRAVEEQINAELAEKAGLDYVNGKFSFIDNELGLIDGKIISINTQIDELDDEIRLKADKTQVDAIEGEITNVAYDLSQLTINVDGIQSQVVSLRSDLDNLEVGGRNLLRNSRLVTNSSNNSSEYPVSQTNEGEYLRYSPTQNSPTGYINMYNVLNREPFMVTDYNWKGKNVTASLWVRTNRPGSFVRVRLAYGTSTLALKHNPIPVGEWVQVHVTANDVVRNATTDDIIRVFIGVTNGTEGSLSNMYVDMSGYYLDTRDWKIEYGNKPTDWSPAPEDAESRISRAETLIDQNAQQIALRATKTEVNSLADRMTQAESELVVLADEINLKVDVDGIVSAINLSQEGIRIKGSLIHLDGLTLIDSGIIQTAHIENAAITRAKLGTAVIGTAQIENLAVTSAKIASVNADKINAASLSAISANLGTVTAGIMRSNNNNMELNLNTGTLNMRNTNFTLGGGADIKFDNANNRAYYSRFDSSAGYSRTAGIGFGISINDTYPFAFLGTTGTGRVNFNPTDSSYFSGFITNTRARTVEDGIGNSVVGNIFHIRDVAVSFSKGFEFDLNGNTITMRGFNTGIYNYDLGLDNAHFRRMHIGEFRTVTGQIDIRNTSATAQGWRLETSYNQVGSHNFMTFYGLNSASDHFYNLGKPNRRFRYIYLAYPPETGSDQRLKTDIRDNGLGLDFIRSIETKSFRLKGSGPEPLQFGVIAQQLRDALIQHDVDINDLSMLSQDDDGMYGVQKEQLIAPIIKSVQELDTKLENEVNWLKVENQLLRVEIKQLKEKIA
ncbi:phage tail spike protein [Halalkalibacterium halodurans]|uniref:phage tail spike protein n=1 Tax=Halalkalibacterium halodurans TaxID=86665 RepID=UPI002E1A5417|nr:phage tail spike protein [Halalkalibacterium halodurans]MED4080095.1 phage tail spike protein [Halalkalibacterium halodurans]MED4084940.1 phage tail spike protein [Halalkalibacterium halodurans]MED4104907.1 phage tail spike protein [Halalkalibacterium halodurans]MED4110432.1 phage tail spike protein [Halalkalibacterium halodurans]MED4123042.1 phage tail spike protein [Halalkalibacterium halodurans]